MKIRIHLMALALFFAFAATAFAQDVYVDGSWTSQGDVNTYNASLVWGSDAFATIQEGHDAAAAGETVLVRDGVYNENVTITKGITLISENGRANTSIVGSNVTQGTVYIVASVDGFKIGQAGQGFTIVGYDNPNPAIERAALYMKGSHDNFEIVGNDIVANGDAALLAEYGYFVTNGLIDNNIFSGKTFVGTNPAGNGSSAQFSLHNTPRSAVYFGGANNSDITFSNNTITAVTGGCSMTDNNGNPTAIHEQGNTSINIDGTDLTITGNVFDGVATRYGAALRSRKGTATTIITGNSFIGAYPIYFAADDNSIENARANNVFANNTFADGGTFVVVTPGDGSYVVPGSFNFACDCYTVYVDDDWVGASVGDIVNANGTFATFGSTAFATVQGGVDGVCDGGLVNVFAGTYEEQVTVDNKTVTLKGAGSAVTTIASPTTLAITFSTSKDYHSIVAAKNGAQLHFEGFTVDGLGRGNGNYRFNGVSYYNAGGTTMDCKIINVMDTPFAGAQHGVGFYAYAPATPSVVSFLNNEITSFQKNATVFAGAFLEAHVSGNTITGAGPTGITAQNGIQVSYGATGYVNGNTISEIGYTGPTYVACGILIYDSPYALVENNIVSDCHVGIYGWNTNSDFVGNAVYYTYDLGVPYTVAMYADPGESPVIQAQPLIVEPTFLGGAGPVHSIVHYNISSNVLQGLDLDDSHGLFIETFDGYEVEAEVRYNLISNFETGIRVEEESDDLITVLNVNNNAIFNNTQYGFLNGAEIIANAEYNWWGDCSGPDDNSGTKELPYYPDDDNVSAYSNVNGLGNAVTSRVDYFPWVGEGVSLDAALWLNNATLTGNPIGGALNLWPEVVCSGTGLDAVQGDWKRQPNYVMDSPTSPTGVKFSVAGPDWTYQDAMVVPYDADVTTGRAALGDPGLVSKSLFVVFTPETPTGGTGPQILFEAGGQYSGFNMVIQNNTFLAGMWNPVQRLFWVFTPNNRPSTPMYGELNVAQLEYVYDDTDPQDIVTKFRVILNGQASDWSIYYGLIADPSESGVGAAVMGTAVRNYYLATRYGFHYEGEIHEVIVMNGDIDHQGVYDMINDEYGTSLSYPAPAAPPIAGKGTWNLEVYDNETVADEMINVYPNPATPATKVDISLIESSKVEIALYDIAGKKVLDIYDGNLNRGLSEVGIITDGLANGTYTLTATVNGSKTYTKQLVVVK